MTDRTAVQSSDPVTFTRRGTAVLLVSALSVAVAGYFVGLRQTEAVRGDTAVERVNRRASQPGDVQSSMTYTQIAEQRIGVNRNWKTSLESLVQSEVDLFAERFPSEDQKFASLASRATLRAFNGAPPVVPHRIDQLSSAACLVCHEDGLLTTEFVAAKMPHEYLANCTQCHVERTSSSSLPAFTLADSNFVGLAAPMAGARAWPGAPPVVPHSVWMRNDCTSCHGVTARPGMETTHPWRQNCLQCHALSATLNQSPVDRSPSFMPGPEVLK